MIPELDDEGHLPAGIHPATLDEIDARFGQATEVRQAEMESLRWLVDLARRAGVLRVVINGSFVTDVDEPNDVDCVILIDTSYPHDAAAEKGIQQGLPFLQVEYAEQPDFDWFVNRWFAETEDFKPKGMVEVIL